MPKSDLPIGGECAPVADRIALFYERFPAGRIITHLTMHNEREIVFRATVYRTEDSRAEEMAKAARARGRLSARNERVTTAHLLRRSHLARCRGKRRPTQARPRLGMG